jgi:hypothetical protein
MLLIAPLLAGSLLTRRVLPRMVRLRDDHGFSTAELLGNAALGIAALVAIWAVLQALGVNIVGWIADQLGVAASTEAP